MLMTWLINHNCGIILLSIPFIAITYGWILFTDTVREVIRKNYYPNRKIRG